MIAALLRLILAELRLFVARLLREKAIKDKARNRRDSARRDYERKRRDATSDKDWLHDRFGRHNGNGNG